MLYLVIEQLSNGQYRVGLINAKNSDEAKVLFNSVQVPIRWIAFNEEQVKAITDYDNAAIIKVM